MVPRNNCSEVRIFPYFCIVFATAALSKHILSVKNFFTTVKKSFPKDTKDVFFNCPT